MFHKYLICLVVCVLVNVNQGCNGERTKDKMYEMIEGAAACFRRLNSTHQTGCTSTRAGSTGVIHIIETDEDLDFVLKKGNADPYMPVLPIDKLAPPLLRTLKQHPDRIAGIIVHKNITRPVNFSHEAQCPNQLYGLPNTCSAAVSPVNPFGTGMLLEDFPFPIFLVQDNENLAKIERCFQKFNNFDRDNQNLRSLCSLELASFMFAAVNSQTCIRRSNSMTNITPTRFCDALGDRNVWATLTPWLNRTDVILVTARMDTTSFFNEVTPGAESPLTGLVALLSTAYALKQMVRDTTTHFHKNIFFILFNGETYDYIGSQRFVYDVLNGKFPMERDDNIREQLPQLALSDIKLIVELGQLNPTHHHHHHSSKLFTHHIQYNSSTQLSKFKKLLKKYSPKYKFEVMESNELPPASLHTFLLEDERIEGLVLTDHRDEFTNHFYNSIFDDKDNIQYKYMNRSGEEARDLERDSDSVQAYIANVSMMLARSLYEETTGVAYTGADVPVAHIVDELFHCYLDTADCRFYQTITLKEHIAEKPLSLYVGVEGSSNLITALTGLSLAWLSGDVTNVTKDNCTGDAHTPVYQYVWMSRNLSNINDTACYRTTMNFTLAVSPAFIIDDYDWSSNKYSTWTESVWKDLYVRMYLKPSARHEIMTFSVGSATFVLSMALVYFVKTRSDILFARLEASSSGTSC